MKNLSQKAHGLTVQRFGKTIQLFAPLYLYNVCIDTCVYCGFSLNYQFERKTLTVEEVLF
ncbi:MAG: 2-iminoacetate synthase ThiH, partial [Deltaproteobacteria bacterium]|nr:2-iminoacetate synthase ThiH [Deltaproteobacteria bacterium]